MPKDTLGGGFVDYNTNTTIKAILRNLKLKVIKPLPEISVGIWPNDQHPSKDWKGDLTISQNLRFNNYVQLCITISVLEKEGQLRLEIEDAVLHPEYAQQAYQDVAVLKLKPTDSK